MMKASAKKIAGYILMLLFFSPSAIAQNLYSTCDTAATKLKGSFKAGTDEFENADPAIVPEIKKRTQ
jgi:hypothetical protein